MSVNTDAAGANFGPDAPVICRGEGDLHSVRITPPGITPLTGT